jgi:RNA polymerase sigma factor (sigma-70 family)
MSEKMYFEPDDRNQLKNWYSLYYPMVRRLVIEAGGTTEDAKDILQDSLIVLFEKRRTREFKLTSKESTFVYGIAFNKWRDFSRKNNKHLLVTDNIDLSEYEITDDSLYDEEKEKDLERIKDCIEKLPNTRKKIIIDYYYAKYSMKEIANKYDELKNEDSVKTQKYKAVFDLKKCFEISKQ